MLVRVYLADLKFMKTKCGFDTIDLPNLTRQKVVSVDLDEGALITMKSQHTYLGVVLNDGQVVLEVNSSEPQVRVVSPYGSWIEGNLKVVKKSGKFQIKEQNIIECKRRIWK